MSKTMINQMKLLLRSVAPAVGEAWEAGYECALLLGAEEDNPFIPGEPEYIAWQEGWWFGVYGEEKLYNWEVSQTIH